MATPSSESTTPSTSPTISSQTAVYPLSATGFTLSTSSPSSRSLKRSHHGMDSSHPNSPNLDAFLTTARYGKIARELRARLSYANFKASNNASHLPFNALEQQFPPAPASRSSPMTEPISPRHRLTHTQMMPPPPSPSSKSLYSALLGSASIPSAKRARLSSADGRSSHHPVSNLDPPRGSRSIRSRPGFPTTDGDDINAAATLTSLLLNRPAARSESSLSRTSSNASVTAFQSSQQSQFQQNSQSSTSSRQPSRTSSSVLAPPARIRTPQPDDAQAAELMLFLATSPSPVRKASNRSNDQSRPGRQQQLFTASRVLFPSTDKPDPAALSAQASAVQASHHARHNSASNTNQLLPPPPSPTRSSHKRSQSDLSHLPLTPKASFNLGDFINVSPSPQRSGAASNRAPGLGKAEGRRLFMDDDVPSGPLASSFSSSAVRSPAASGGRSTRYGGGKRPSANSRKSGAQSVIGTRTAITPALGTTVAGA